MFLKKICDFSERRSKQKIAKMENIPIQKKNFLKMGCFGLNKTVKKRIRGWKNKVTKVAICIYAALHSQMCAFRAKTTMDVGMSRARTTSSVKK